MLTRWNASPVLARVVPFAAFALLTLAQGQLGDVSQYWVYALKTLLGAWLLWSVRHAVPEMRWKLSWEAVAAGVAVFALWVGLDGRYPTLSQQAATFNPNRSFGEGTTLAWAAILIRLIGSSVVVPPLEEVFYRSFLYRYLSRYDFLAVPLDRLEWKPFVTAGVVFGIGHLEWLPGILCAFIYQGLVCRKGRLGDAMTAHAITNLLLGLWVVGRGEWHLW